MVTRSQHITDIKAEKAKLMRDYGSGKHNILYRVKIKGKWSGWKSLLKANKDSPWNSNMRFTLWPWHMGGKNKWDKNGEVTGVYKYEEVEWKQGKPYKLLDENPNLKREGWRTIGRTPSIKGVQSMVNMYFNDTKYVVTPDLKIHHPTKDTSKIRVWKKIGGTSYVVQKYF